MDKKAFKTRIVTAAVLVLAALLAFVIGAGSCNSADKSLLSDITNAAGETVFPTVTTVDGTGAWAVLETTTEKTRFLDNFTTVPTEETLGTASTEVTETAEVTEAAKYYRFRNEELFESHYQKHGAEFGDITKDEYLEMANALINSAGGAGILEKTQDDGDRLIYDERSNEFIVISPDGYIRSFFRPEDKKEYFDRQ